MKNKKTESKENNCSITLHFQTYGGRFEGVYFDSHSISSIDRLLNCDASALYNIEDNENFIIDLFELSNFSDLCCLTDSIFIDGDLNDEMLIVGGFKDLNKIISPISAFTIDDLQSDTIIKRWSNLFIDQEELDWKTAIQFTQSKENKAFLKGLLYEEIFGCTYFPSLSNTRRYLLNSPFRQDYVLHNLLIEAYGFIKKSEEKKKALRQIIGGVAEPNTPPVMSMILNRISKPQEYLNELLILRNEFTKIRKRASEIKHLSNEEISFDEWLKTYKKMKSDLNVLLKEYNYTNNLFEANRSSIDDMISFTMNAGDDDLSDISIDVKKLAKFGYDKVSEALKKNKIQPLPRIVKNLDKIGNQFNKAKKIWNVTKESISFNKQYSNINSEVNSAYDVLTIANKIDALHLSVPSYFSFRKHGEALFYAKPFDYEKLIDSFVIECLVRARVHFAKTKGSRSHNYKKLDLHLDFGYHYLEYKYLSKAREHFLKALDITKDCHEVYHGLSQIELENEQYNLAIDLLHKALALEPESTMILNDIGVAHTKNNNYQKAVEYFKRTLQVQPNFKGYKLNLANAYYHLNEFDRAVVLTDEIMENEEEKLDLDVYKFHLNLLTKLYKKEELQTAVHKLSHIAQLLFNEGNFDGSRLVFQLLVGFKLLKKDTLYNLGVRLDRKKNHKEANNFYLLELEICRDNSECLSNYATNLMELGETDKVINYVLEAVKLDPDNLINLNTLMMCYFKLENLKELTNTAKSISKIGKPQSPQLEQIYNTANLILKEYAND